MSNNVKNRIRIISQATGRKYVDAKKILKEIQNVNYEDAQADRNPYEGKDFQWHPKDKINNCSHIINIRPLNYVKSGKEYYGRAFIYELQERGKEEFNVIISDKTNQTMKNIHKDFQDRLRILKIYPKQKFTNTIYTVNEKGLTNDSEKEEFKKLYSKALGQ